MTKTRYVSRTFMLLFFCCVGFSRARGADLTFTGSFTADDSLFSYSLTTTTTQDFNFYTTSYAGGMNADGSVSAAGGFDPVLTLFSPTGSVVGFGGAGGACGKGGVGDPVTGLCNDADFSEVLAPGTYDLVLSEFPNVPIGNLSDGFLFAGDPTATGDTCGVSGGMFLEADVAPCVQRDASYAVDITSTSPVPEPSSWLLVLPGMVALIAVGRQQLA